MAAVSASSYWVFATLFVTRNLQCSAMTGIAGDTLLSVEVLPVDCHLQQDHPPGLLFGLLGIPVKNRRNVAILARYAERCIERHHNRIHVRCGNALEHLDVLVNRSEERRVGKECRS